MLQIKDVSNNVDRGSDEVAGAANELATGTGEQASAIEELTATIAQVYEKSQSVDNSADALINDVEVFKTE